MCDAVTTALTCSLNPGASLQPRSPQPFVQMKRGPAGRVTLSGAGSRTALLFCYTGYLQPCFSQCCLSAADCTVVKRVRRSRNRGPPPPAPAHCHPGGTERRAGRGRGRRPEPDSQLNGLGLWESNLTSLRLSCLIYKMDVITWPEDAVWPRQWPSPDLLCLNYN